ncbi:uncharacterized, partial [Tachysurus ichikawai]
PTPLRRLDKESRLEDLIRLGKEAVFCGTHDS